MPRLRAVVGYGRGWKPRLREMVNVAEQPPLRIPPICHFSDNRQVKEIGSSIAGIVSLIGKPGRNRYRDGRCS